MTTAYMKVKETGAAIQTTVRELVVRDSSLRHKLNGRINPEAVRSGPPPLFCTRRRKSLGKPPEVYGIYWIWL